MELWEKISNNKFVQPILKKTSSRLIYLRFASRGVSWEIFILGNYIISQFYIKDIREKLIVLWILKIIILLRVVRMDLFIYGFIKIVNCKNNKKLWVIWPKLPNLIIQFFLLILRMIIISLELKVLKSMNLEMDNPIWLCKDIQKANVKLFFFIFIINYIFFFINK